MGNIIDSLFHFDNYLLSLNTLESDFKRDKVNSILAQIKEDIKKDGCDDISISETQGYFLSFLIRSFKIKRILELGVYYGYSSLSMGLSLKDVEGKDKLIIACDHNQNYLDKAALYWKKAGVDSFIYPKLGDASDILDYYQKNPLPNLFDLVFIDADKGNYLKYYEKSLSLVRSGGFILFDNALWRGYVLDKERFSTDRVAKIIHQFNQAVFKDPRTLKTCLLLGDGFLWVIKK